MAGNKNTLRKKKSKLTFTKGVAHIQATYNNTIVTITDEQGHAIAWASAGVVGYKGARKSTPFAAQLSSEKCAKECYDRGLRTVSVKIKGPGPGRETALRALESAGLKVDGIEDVTPVPHNGCRPEKRPRN